MPTKKETAAFLPLSAKRQAWGRIGTRGQELSQHFSSEAEAVALLREIARRKNAKGYVSKASRGNSEFGIECPMPGIRLLEPATQIDFTAHRT